MSDLSTRAPVREVARAKPAEPAPLSPLPEHDGVLADASGADSQAASTARYRRRVLLTLGAIVLALGLYWASGYVFAYTDDAYVTSDLVSVAPYISGRVVAVPIVDNQTVTKGSFWQRSIRLRFSWRSPRNRQSVPKPRRSSQSTSCDRICASAARRGGCQGTAGKRQCAPGDANHSRRLLLPSRARYLDSERTGSKGGAGLCGGRLAKAQQMLTLHQTTVTTITAEIAFCNGSSIRQSCWPDRRDDYQSHLARGDQAIENVPLIGLVDAHAWRIFANYKESMVRHMKVGHTAWVWLDTIHGISIVRRSRA